MFFYLQVAKDTTALVFEIADKHDQILSLKGEIKLLEDQLRQAESKLLYKDELIKGLRRDCRELAKVN